MNEQSTDAPVTSFRCPRELRVAIATRAQAEGVSASAIIKAALRDLVAQEASRPFDGASVAAYVMSVN